MFTNACDLYYNLMCDVGGGSAHIQGSLFGTGCLISQQHVLTARHNVIPLHHECSWPVILKHDGLWKCKIIFESQTHDLAVMEATDLVQEVSLRGPAGFPLLPTTPVDLGMTVGYLARMRYPDHNGNETRNTCFSQSSVSMMNVQPNDGPTFWMLGDGFIQSGFSGGPVFSADGTLHGLIVQSFQFEASTGNQRIQTLTKPVMSPIGPVMSHIRKFMNS